jgi:hypothetical protein
MIHRALTMTGKPNESEEIQQQFLLGELFFSRNLFEN